MPLSRVTELIDQAEAVLQAAQRLLGTAVSGQIGQSTADDAVLELYERLRQRLAQIDDAAITELITSVGQSIQGLSRVEAELARVRKLRAALEQL